MIAEANRIFGFDGWERSTLISRCVAEHERPIGRDRKSGWGVTYIARVRITITAGQRTLIREGSGAGHGSSTLIWAWPMNRPSRKPKPMPPSEP